MKRREFLTMALGAVLVIPIVGQTTAANSKKEIEKGLNDIAVLYIDGSEQYRENTIKEISHLISNLRSKEAVRMMTGYRDILLSYNVIPAKEVKNEQ